MPIHEISGVRSRSVILLIGLLGLIAAGCFLTLSVHRGIGTFQLTHFHFNYSDEFLRRGFVGEVLRQIGFPLSSLNVALLYSAAVVLFLLLLVIACAWTFARLPARTGALFVVFMLACPGLTLHYAYSAYGYLDIFQLLLAAAGLMIIYRSTLPVALATAVLLSAMSILIHEIGLFFTAPIFIAALLLRFHARLGVQSMLALFGALLLLTIFVWRLGGTSTMSFDDHVAALTASAAHPDYIHPAAVLVLHRSLAENVGLIIPKSFLWYLLQQIKFFLLALPYLFFAVVSLQAAKAYLSNAGQKPGAAALILAVIAPVLLYPIGHDYFRWWSAAAANYFLLIFFLCAIHLDFRDRLQTLMDRHKRIMIIGILIGLTVGGIGGMVSFSIHTAPPAMFYRMIF